MSRKGERLENNAYRNRKLYCPILPPLCIGKRITWEPKDSCFPISAGRLIGSLIVSHVHATTYFSIYYKRETKKVIILIHLLSKERPVFSSPTLLQTVFYTETLLVRTLRLFFMVFLIFSPFLLPLLFGILIWVGGVLASSYPSYLFGQNDHSEELNKKK